MDNMQEQMRYASRQMETLRMNQKKMLEIKHTEMEKKNAFDRVMTNLAMIRKESEI
jgi:hypothetical protein